MADMADVHEKILAMLANVKEMRKNLNKRPILDATGLISKQDLLKEYNLPERTAQRRINELIEKNLLEKVKRGRVVFYRKKPDYPHTPSVDSLK